MRLRAKQFVFALVLLGVALAGFSCLGQDTLIKKTGWGVFLLPSHGTLVGEFEGVTIYSANGPSVRGDYGLEYECVELVNRFYTQKLAHKNMTKTGHADSYYWDPGPKGLVAYENGGNEPPKKYDILVFDGGDSDGSVGHVALITEVDHQRNVLHIVQQNTPETRYYILRHYRWQDELPFSRTQTGGWFVSQGDFSIPVAGWSRRKEAP